MVSPNFDRVRKAIAYVTSGQFNRLILVLLLKVQHLVMATLREIL
jgi:hypothetical protein